MYHWHGKRHLGASDQIHRCCTALCREARWTHRVGRNMRLASRSKSKCLPRDRHDCSLQNASNRGGQTGSPSASRPPRPSSAPPSASGSETRGACHPYSFLKQFTYQRIVRSQVDRLPVCASHLRHRPHTCALQHRKHLLPPLPRVDTNAHPARLTPSPPSARLLI